MGNDRFKFRWWNKRENLMEYDIGQEKIAWLLAECDTMMQCTGLKDKNGALIYEGDIVSFLVDGEPCILPVTWNHDRAAWSPFCDESGRIYSNEYEILDNIYEHPELLK